MFNRQKLLLSIANIVSKNRPNAKKTYLMKTVFLLKQRLPEEVAYDFFPHNYGPFSQTIYEDLNFLESENLINTDNLELKNKGKQIANAFDLSDNLYHELISITSDFKSTEKIREFVYDNYPKYIVKSKLNKTPKKKTKGIFSIGYEGKSVDFFLNLLIQNQISLLVDVRKNAFSMKKGFSKNQLKHYLELAGIGYLHLPEFGIESDKRKKLETVEDYKQLFEDYKKTLSKKGEELNRLERLGKTESIALMCFEADKDYCHRGVISDALHAEVVHI